VHQQERQRIRPDTWDVKVVQAAANVERGLAKLLAALA
jgi:hypothetical protein